MVVGESFVDDPCGTPRFVFLKGRPGLGRGVADGSPGAPGKEREEVGSPPTRPDPPDTRVGVPPRLRASGPPPSPSGSLVVTHQDRFVPDRSGGSEPLGTHLDVGRDPTRSSGSGGTSLPSDVQSTRSLPSGTTETRLWGGSGSYSCPSTGTLSSSFVRDVSDPQLFPFVPIKYVNCRGCFVRHSSCNPSLIRSNGVQGKGRTPPPRRV